jgi:outer membrane receptor protein involved in Fe transport
VATLCAASAVSVFAEGPGTQSAHPSTAVPVAGGWTARFFVNPTAPPPGMAEESVIRRNATAGVNAQFSKRLWQGTRFTVDVVNVFDREPPLATGLLPPPAEGRGIRLTLRKTF